MTRPKTIAIDFDGVIHKYSLGWHDGTCYDVPMEGAFAAIKKLRAKGFNIVVHTARPAADAEKWLIHNCPEDMEVPPVTNIKPIAVAYIDDRALRFTNWKDILNYF